MAPAAAVAIAVFKKSRLLFFMAPFTKVEDKKKPETSG
jgi:hypothetical protein